jgi:hypothetical protein
MNAPVSEIPIYVAEVAARAVRRRVYLAVYVEAGKEV